MAEMTGGRRVEIDEERRVFDDFFQIDEAVLRFEKFDGELSEPVRRLNFERGDAVAAVIWNRDRDVLILTEQFRYPTVHKGPGWLTEVVAGMVGAGENPEDTMRREIHEEVGYDVGELERIAEFYVSPGGSSERITLFYVEVGDADRSGDGGGEAAEGEDIRVVELPVREVGAALASSACADAKTIIGLMWLQAELLAAGREGD